MQAGAIFRPPANFQLTVPARKESVMARVFRHVYTARVPKGATVVEVAGVRYAEWTPRGAARPARWPLAPDGLRVTVTVPAWYCEFWDHRGKLVRVKGFRDKRATDSLLAKLLREDDRRRLGVAGPAAGYAGRPLAGLLDEYLALLAARGNGADYLAVVRQQADAVLAGVAAYAFADLDADRVVTWLGNLRAAKKLSPATLNGYLRSVKGFAKWLAGKLQAPSPLAALPAFPEEAGRKRSRRVLTDAELAALVAAAPPDRAMLYRAAAMTGLRASELASLTPASFAAAGPRPVVRVEARDAKGRREEVVPLPRPLAAALRGWLAGKPAGQPVWPGNWARNRHQAKWLAKDLRAAGVPALDARGRKATFHGLRRRYATRLVETGATIDQVRRLARHRDIKTTLGYYVDTDLDALAGAAERVALPRARRPA